MRHKLHAALIALAIAVALAACSNDDGGRSTGTTTRPAPTHATATTLVVPVFDWAHPKPTDLGGGFAIEDCEGDAPFFCVRRDGEIVGTLEVLRLDLEGKTPEDQAQGFLNTFRDDRMKTCPGHAFSADAIAHVTTADGESIRYSYTLRNGKDVVERVVQYAGVRDGKHVVIAANAIDEGGCLTREGEFATDDLIAFEPRFDALVRVSGLP